ncbi:MULTISPECIES: dihydroorotase family protein [unclassified Novosphingobium]|uniref:dihydroorotase n=1 Tax=unclassified Novosphingobium TaxID=2644732 RepID=UPI000D31D08E|nr:MULTISPECIES: amidohydrolase family protein [unclassified Novosphingobium]PTR09790.1 dihydroorotase [Novosphingobium sp. GV055]PUB02577.1 dihydroorotase [Novosphingobium sp. GV061]PUB19522.1 dihydroorotase [Novosphingobium sp. GV079]PUB40946.1 dihydroorotase [Novosphingobium sp. GV027]
MTPQPLVITNGRLVLPTGEPMAADLRCQGGRIVALGAEAVAQDGDAVFDARGALVAPGLVDLGVFAIDKPAFHFGGITRAALMPDQGPPLDHPARVRFAAQSGKPDFWVHPLAAATRGLEGAELAELALMRDAGARAVSTGRRWIADSGVMLRLLSYCAMLDLVVVTHAEDDGITGHAVATAGEVATRLGLPSAPAEAESLAVARDIALAEMTDARLHIRQVTTAKALDLVRAAKLRGVQVTAGVTPAHFMLSDLELVDFRTFCRFSPPLRADADRKAVIAAIGDGTIDVIASGHDPRGPEDKRLPFADAEPGMAGAETLLPLTLTLVRDGVIDMARAFALLAGNPAALLGVNAGRLAVGAEADLAVIHPTRPWVVNSDKMAASAGNTPFDRRPVEGRVLALWKGGARID